MKMIINGTMGALLVLLVYGCMLIPEQVEQVAWRIDSLETIGGHPVTVIGDPKVVQTRYGKAVTFDGDGDRIQVPHNPLGDATEFTVEIVFRANDVYPDNWEPRFLHIQDPENPQRRITIELRLTDSGQWYLDAFIMSELSNYTLIDATLLHPTEKWAHAAITFKDRTFTSYVNGVEELSAEVDYLPIGERGMTSIGGRMNDVHWFNGDILTIRVTHRVLAPEEFVVFEDLY
ncbi:LamG domain-containing protein [Marinimicrobium alkaliphilum]|uniref:LamG domain-containing protein n=1 Tax=Marinimicrobium alkaliphilum TaxID=2202654 RepID=UPI000DB9F414|nr:LamG domain-containing protein [Marinimicrobium alkaliphilum]